ncbi:hypothetical protein SAMN04488128_103651 [Chitinophaga eiseniae]|uniref:DUF4175 family protein n=1 Tax=Chitinophaga eiseniae TaxID=634771 RepID=A0A1T4SW44_9BACT|nr:DUF4175 family protein [Chitinophaga eiseniae]SKA32366.1 hypothetical protein SAMN04488128_103651 [Chitinophaga eiseniae]
MNDVNGHMKIAGIRTRWVRSQQLRYGLLSIALAAPLALFGIIPAIAGGVLSLFVQLWWHKPCRLQEEEVARYLNQTFPELEDSAALLLKPAADRNLLETLQAEKISPVLENLQLPGKFYRPLRQALLIASFMVAFTIGWHMLNTYLAKLPVTTNNAPGPATKPEKILPGINGVQITLQPPAYMRRSALTQSAFNITAPDSSLIKWEIHTNKEVQELSLLFNDSTRLTLQPDVEHTTWTATRTVRKSGFYQVSMNDRLSELYQLQLVPDQLPVIRITNPKPFTTIEFGQSTKVNVQAALTDDYGIRDAHIALTIASGSGEAVRFKDQELPFDNSFSARLPRYQVSKTLNLTAMGLKPGDELYFHIRVTDTRRQENRSDVYIITLPDTAQLFSMEGMVTGVAFKPEYFRSQRQIILDAEQLLREKDSIGTAKFNSRSNDLGTDQKLLRLRYGKFLGEESESNVGDPRVAAEEGHDDHDHGHDHHGKEAHEGVDPGDFGNAAKVLDEFTDKHDNAEDATFFDPEIKKQLKATLTEMWKSELQLRLYKPQEALPFAYKALRLLKDLQQQSRVYVAKTGVKTTPLKPEKRLTGEQDKIRPRQQKETAAYQDQLLKVRQALAALDAMKAGDTGGHAAVLREAQQLLTTQAAATPAAYLPALEAMRRIQTLKSTEKDIRTAQRGLQKILTAPPLQPQRTPAPVSPSLPQHYFHNLKTGTP